MPREMVRAPGHERDRSLGWLGIAWMEHFCRHGPGDVEGDPVRHDLELSAFLADAYALDPAGRRLYDSVFFSRPKGRDKSGTAARVALLEALGPCRFAGWAEGGEVYAWLDFEYRYRPGEPMGRAVRSPFVRLLATEEGQTGNVYDSVYYNLTDAAAPLSRLPRLDAGMTRTYLPGGRPGSGEIRPSTASSAAKEGGLETFAVFDEPLALDTPIPTPFGWRRMADLKVGDYVFGSDGRPVLVWGVSPIKYNRDCYRVVFDDGTAVVTDAAHRWLVFDRKSRHRWVEQTTEQMAAQSWYGGTRFAVAQPAPLALDDAELSLDPYVLGLWLGDGDKRVAVLEVGRDDLDEQLAGVSWLAPSKLV